jgi:hypothetical protein
MMNGSELLIFIMQISVVAIGLTILDKLMVYFGDDYKQKNRRWFLIHALTNALIVGMTFQNLVNLFFNPFDILGNCSTMAMAVQIGLHVYHIFASYDHMDIIDWIHHLVSSVIVGTISAYFFRGQILNLMLFFMCGLPGGIDYLLLALVKYKLMDSITEKGINVYLNMWIRLPGILFTCFVTYINIIIGNTDNVLVACWIVFLNAFNGIYFATRVVKNYGESLVKRELLQNRESQRESLKRIPSVGGFDLINKNIIE